MKNIVKKILLESRRKDIIDKYRKIYDEQDDKLTDQLVQIYEESLPPKYLEYALKSTCCGRLGGEIGDVIDIILDFDDLIKGNYIENKDIYSSEYQTPNGSSFYDNKIFSVVGEARKKKDENVRNKELSGSVTKIYEDDRWLVISPKTHEASCHYGSGTKWCTTSKTDPTTFGRYISNGELFYLIDKTTSDRSNVMYRIALNWKWKDVWGDTINTRLEDGGEWFDSKDEKIRGSHIIPLLPKKLIESITTHYNSRIKEVIDIENKSFNEIVEFTKKPMIFNLLLKKLKIELNNEVFVKIGGGVDSIENDGTDSITISLNSDDLVVEIYRGDKIYEIRSTSGEMSQPRLYTSIGEGDLYFWNNLVYTITGRRILFNNPSNFKKQLEQFKDEILNNADTIVDLIYNDIIRVIKKHTWNPKPGDTYKILNGVAYWGAMNSSSTIKFNYPPKSDGLTHKFVNYIKQNPGSTPKEYYEKFHPDFKYYPGYNAHFFGSIKDSGILRIEKGSYGTHKYYIGPTYKYWVKGKLVKI